MISEKMDFSMSGLGSSDGGLFGRVEVSGVYTFNTNVTCQNFECSGVSKFKKSLQAQKFETSGVTKIAQSLKAERMEVSGTCKIGTDLDVGDMRTSGIVKVGQNLKAQHIDVCGMLKVSDNIETESMKIYGQLRNDAFINAESVYIQAEANSQFNEIGATKVEIKDERADSFWYSIMYTLYRIFTLNFKGDHATVGKLIEGDEIDIEYSKIETIRGKHVKIGPHCIVNEVEYSETLEIDETAKVLSTKHTKVK